MKNFVLRNFEKHKMDLDYGYLTTVYAYPKPIDMKVHTNVDHERPSNPRPPDSEGSDHYQLSEQERQASTYCQSLEAT